MGFRQTKLEMMKRLIILTFAVVSLCYSASSQEAEAGVFLGGSYYLGDINPGIPFMQTSFAYGALMRYNLNTRLAARLSFFRGKISGDDNLAKVNTVRDLKFESNISDITAQFEFNFLPYFTGSTRNYMSTYIFGGISMFFFNPKSNGVALRDIGTEGQLVGFDGRKKYSKVGIAIPFGLGFKYSLTKKLAVGLEWGMRRTYSDYLDDISKTYYLVGSDINPENTDEYLSDPTRTYEPGMQRGNPKTKDWYSFAGIYITYKFNLFGREKCLDTQLHGSYKKL